MVNVRKAMRSDYQEIADMIDRCYELDLQPEALDIAFDKPASLAIMDHYLETSLVADVNGKIVGLLAGQVSKLPSSGEMVFQETLWLVAPEYRGRGISIFYELERMCISEGVQFIVAGHMVNEQGHRLSRLYQRMGFVPLEVHYIKKLGEL